MGAGAAPHQDTGLVPGPHYQGHSVMGTKLFKAFGGWVGPSSPQGRDPHSWHKPAERDLPTALPQPPQNRTSPNPIPIPVAVPALSLWAPVWHQHPKTAHLRASWCEPAGTGDGTRTLKEK